MSKTDIEYLLEKYKTGTITPEEMELLESWYLQWHPEKVDISVQELEKAKSEVWNEIGAGGNKKPAFRFLAAAAIAAVFVIASFLAYFLISEKSTLKKQAFAVRSEKDFLPGSNKAILTLSNGKQIILKDALQGKLAEENSIQVSKTAEGGIVYAPADRSANISDKLIYNTITTPRGGQYHVVLSDGTRVWLNAASSITYPVAFLGKERNVRITGEAYFEVAHNAKMPFRVASKNQEVTVLGTHFNMSSYTDDLESSTVLLSGSVQVKNPQSGILRTLTPGQGSKILNGKGEIAVEAVNIEQATAWRSGYFIFDNQDIKSIMKVLSRWYDVDVEYRIGNADERFGGTFSRSKNLSETLKNIEELSRVRFKLNGGKIIVSDY
jgi:transmembrane sensor